jgi:TolB-like protein
LDIPRFHVAVSLFICASFGIARILYISCSGMEGEPDKVSKGANIMKKFFFALLACLAAAGASAQNVTLDAAIRTTASEMSQRLPQGGKVAVLSFTSPSDQLSKYVIDEMNDAIVNEGKLTVVDRQQLDLIMQEMQFQSSGLVGDDSAQEIGRMLGAQYIVSGSMELIAGSYRFRTRALTVENATIIYSGSRNVSSDRIITSLTGGSGRAADGDFTAAERNRARWLNIFWGAGSFSQRDFLGGTVTGLLEVGGLALILAGGIPILSRQISDPITRESESGSYNNYGSSGYGSSYEEYTFDGETYDSYSEASDAWTKKDIESGVLAGVGVLVGTVGLVYGFIRPSFAHRSGFVAGGFANPENLKIALVSDNRGEPAFRLTYRMSF